MRATPDPRDPSTWAIRDSDCYEDVGDIALTDADCQAIAAVLDRARTRRALRQRTNVEAGGPDAA